MFESVLVRRHGDGQQIVDPGLLAETLLFYENVHVLADRGIIPELANKIGKRSLIELLKNGHMTLTFVPEIFGTMTNNENNVQIHKFVAFTIEGKGTNRRLSIHDQLHLLLERAVGKSRETRRFANELFPLIKTKKSSNQLSQDIEPVTAAAEQDISDQQFVDAAVRDIIENLLGRDFIPRDWFFYVMPTDNGFLIDTNYQFDRLNEKSRKRFSGQDSPLTPAFLVNHILDARADLQAACFYMAEIVTTPSAAAIIQRKLNSIRVKRDRNAAQIATFQDVFLHNTRALREAINSGERSFEEFLPVLDKAARFKRWLKSMNPDASLIEEFHKSATAATWIEKLPTKVLRLAVATAVGIANPVAGTMLSAADSLILDKLGRGWRPHQFVNRVLKEFVAAD